MFRATLAVVIAIVGLQYGIVDFVLVKSAISRSNPRVVAAFSSVLCTFMILRLLRSRGFPLTWFKVFTHELTHVLVSLLFFRGIASFRADRHTGGEVIAEGRANILISLAPYCLSIYTLFTLAVLPLLRTSFEVYASIVVGITYGFHLTTHVEQASYLQPDIQFYGRFLSAVFIFLVQAIMLGLILTVLSSGWSSVGTYLLAGLCVGPTTSRHIYSSVSDFISRIMQ